MFHPRPPPVVIARIREYLQRQYPILASSLVAASKSKPTHDQVVESSNSDSDSVWTSILLTSGVLTVPIVHSDVNNQLRSGAWIVGTMRRMVKLMSRSVAVQYIESTDQE